MAVERHQAAVDGGSITLPGPAEATMPGLRKRLADDELSDLVEVVQADLLTVSEWMQPIDAMWTGCSWHYSLNHRRPLTDFITVMRQLCRPSGGVFGAEYTIPVEPRHFDIEHYLSEGRVHGLLPGRHVDWET